MEFSPTPEKLIPDLTPREEVVLLARPFGAKGTTTTWRATSPTASRTVRSCAIRGTSCGASSGPNRSSGSTASGR